MAPLCDFVCSLQLDPDSPGSHDEDYIYPIGFQTSRKHASATNPSSKCQYQSEITVGPNGKPQFKVTCADMSEHPYEDSTPNVSSLTAKRVFPLRAMRALWQ